MSSRDNGTCRLRPPPPPPRRTSSSRETSPDSGLSVSSTSSIPSTTSLEAASVTEQSHDSQLLEDICSSLDSSTLTVLSLPAVNSKAEKLRTNSHSLNDLKVKEVNKLAPQKPPVPVRRDSLRLERRQSNRAKLEDRFSFHQEAVFPPPPPFTNCPKTFPTKELFGVQSPIPEYKPYEEENKVETLSNPIINAKPKSKKSDGTFFSKIFPSTSQSDPLQTTNSDARSGVLEEKKAAPYSKLETKKPVIAKKPTLERRSITSILPECDRPSRLVSRSQSLYISPRPRIQSSTMSEAGGRDKENVNLEIKTGVRAQVVRRAPPPPPARAQ